ncbi:MAG: hypothetical protein C0595_03495 [Marinilabiliales bacterium]|nr:MAG: hypothetical protein C0595_03495 [Marinilabiliales bacterium]
MLDYDPKVLMAFGETFSEEDGEFLNYLLNNGYPELAALSSGIRGSNEAVDWLFKNKFPHFAAFDNAVSGSIEAYTWLLYNNQNLLALFVDAINNDTNALAWLKNHNLEIFIHLSRKIRNFREGQTFDYHKIHF